MFMRSSGAPFQMSTAERHLRRLRSASHDVACDILNTSRESSYHSVHGGNVDRVSSAHESASEENTWLRRNAYDTPRSSIKFKNLPFFDILCTIFPPSTLTTSADSLHQESHFQFRLTPEQVYSIVASRNLCSNVDFNDYVIQLQLRLSPAHDGNEEDYAFLSTLRVTVNGSTCEFGKQLPATNSMDRPSPDPINITNLCRLSHSESNNLEVSWTSNHCMRAFNIAVFLVRRLRPTDLLLKLRSKGLSNPDASLNLMRKNLRQTSDQIRFRSFRAYTQFSSRGITPSLIVSLMCPIGKMKIQMPCRSSECTHLQCFDAYLFLMNNESNSLWRCPVCNEQVEFSSLIVDGLFVEILEKAPTCSIGVRFNEDGSWFPVKEKYREGGDNNTGNDSALLEKYIDEGVIDLTSDNDSLAEEPGPKFSEVPEIIDLTLIDDVNGEVAETKVVDNQNETPVCNNRSVSDGTTGDSSSCSGMLKGAVEKVTSKRTREYATGERSCPLPVTPKRACAKAVDHTIIEQDEIGENLMETERVSPEVDGRCACALECINVNPLIRGLEKNLRFGESSPEEEGQLKHLSGRSTEGTTVNCPSTEESTKEKILPTGITERASDGVIEKQRAAADVESVTNKSSLPEKQDDSADEHWNVGKPKTHVESWKARLSAVKVDMSITDFSSDEGNALMDQADTEIIDLTADDDFSSERNYRDKQGGEES